MDSEQNHPIDLEDISHSNLNLKILATLLVRGRPLMIWEGDGGNREKKIPRPFSGEKKFSPKSSSAPPDQ